METRRKVNTWRIAFTGGGTGGHIYPGLAIIDALKEAGQRDFYWIGSQTGMDRALVEGAGIPFYGIPAGKLRRYLSLKNLSDVFRVLGGFFAARRILKREGAALLFSKGGFVSVPPVVAAWSLGIPVFTHESDYSPGLATRINLRFVKKVFVPYEETRELLPPAFRSKARVSGNPVRSLFHRADPALGRAFLGLTETEGSAKPLLLVMGGSLGAREINHLVWENLGGLCSLFRVVHQTGRDAEIPSSCRGVEGYRAYPFISGELPHVIAASDLILSRSGAGTIWEAAFLGKPLVLIPLEGSGTRGDQVENARLFEKRGAAVMLRSGVDGRKLLETLGALAGDKEALASMGRAGRALAFPEGSGDAAAPLGLPAAAFMAGEIMKALEGRGEYETCV